MPSSGITLGPAATTMSIRVGGASEATRALVRCAFDALGARVVVVGHAEGNEASRAVIAKLGFEHTIRSPFGHEMPDGTLVDGHGYHRTDPGV